MMVGVVVVGVMMVMICGHTNTPLHVATLTLHSMWTHSMWTHSMWTHSMWTH